MEKEKLRIRGCLFRKAAQEVSPHNAMPGSEREILLVVRRARIAESVSSPGRLDGLVLVPFAELRVEVGFEVVMGHLKMRL